MVGAPFLQNHFSSGQPLPDIQIFELRFLNPAPLLHDVLIYQIYDRQTLAEVAIPTALAAISTVCQGLIDVELPNVGTRPVSLYLLSVAPSGARKTTTQRDFFHAIRQFEKAKEDDNAQAHRKWRLDHRKWQNRLDELQRGFDKASKKGEDTDEITKGILAHEDGEPRPPTPIRLLYDDTTLSTLYKHMQANPNATLIPQEGSSLLHGATLQQINKIAALWDGDDLHIERKDASRSATLRDPRVTIFLSMQPEILQKYLSRREDATRGSGLWSRFLVADLSDQASYQPRIEHEPKPPRTAFDRFENRIIELLERYGQKLRTGHEGRTTVRWSPVAEDTLIIIHNQIQTALGQGRFLDANDMASKLTDQIARVAALLQFFEAPEGEETTIDRHIVASAAYLCLWLSNYWINWFSHQASTRRKAQNLLNYLNSRNSAYYEKVWSLRFIQRNGPSDIRKSRGELDAAVDYLIANNQLQRDDANSVRLVFITPF